MIALDASEVTADRLLVEASWALPSRTEPFDDYLAGSWTSLDLDTLKSAPVADRLEAAERVFGKAGLDGQKPVAVYDRVGLFSAPYAWWLLRSFGTDTVLVEGWAETEKSPPMQPPRTFLPTRDPAESNAMREDVLAAIGSDVQIIDARPEARFRGDSPEPRPGCRAGHIPGSRNVPFGLLKTGRRFKSREELASLFDERGVDLSKPIITSCGSGVTASGLAFALTRCGAEQIQVYQGSWAEWGMDPDLPIETGA